MAEPMSPMGAPPGGPMMQSGLEQMAGGMPGGNPLDALRSLQKTPGPSAEQSALTQAREAIGFAISRILKRSPKVAKELSSALVNLDQAIRELATLPQMDQPAAPPPPGLPMSGMMSGGPPGGGPGGMI